MNADSDQLRVVYEGAVKQNPSDIEAVQYLAVWHLERHSFHQARKYFGHLATLKQFDADVWLCLSVCCAMADEFAECATALKTAQNLIPSSEDDVRVKFCHALMSEKRKDYTVAMEGYVTCLNQCAAQSAEGAEDSTVTVVVPSDEAAGGSSTSEGTGTDATTPAAPTTEATSTPAVQPKLIFMKELRGEVMLRIAVLKKEMGAIDQAMQMCASIQAESFGDSIRANALCLKGLLHEMRAEFPASEVVYRSVLQITSGHSTALERLGRVYLRYRETIPAAVQCFFKSVETNPSNHVAWYLLGRCYMATSQYSDACEAYNRAVNLNPNDPQVWCSLGVLYYAFGQYREALGMLARALKLDSSMADAWYNVGALYDMCDQPEDAQQAYMKAKENGLADRFARAGMGLNPLAMQSLQFINSTPGVGGGVLAPSASGSSAGTGTGASAATAGSVGMMAGTAVSVPAQGSAGLNGTFPPVGLSSGHQLGLSSLANSSAGLSAPSSSSASAAPPNPAPTAYHTTHTTAKAAAAARKQQLQQQQQQQQQQALQQHQLQQQQQQVRMKQMQLEQQAMYHQQQAQQQAQQARVTQYQQQHQQTYAMLEQQQQQQHMSPEQAMQFQQQMLYQQQFLYQQQQAQGQAQGLQYPQQAHSQGGQSQDGPNQDQDAYFGNPHGLQNQFEQAVNSSSSNQGQGQDQHGNNNNSSNNNNNNGNSSDHYSNSGNLPNY